MSVGGYEHYKERSGYRGSTIVDMTRLSFFINGPCSVTASTSHLHCDGGVRIPHVSTIEFIYATLSPYATDSQVSAVYWRDGR